MKNERRTLTAQTTTPPGQTFASRWALYAALGAPKIDLEKWHLAANGLVEKELNLTFQELQALPQVKLTRNFHCLGPGSIVFTNPEPKTIEKIRVGDLIIGLDGKRHLVRKVLQKQHDGQLLKIRASYLPEVMLTPDHKVWTVRGHNGSGRTKSQRRKLTFAKNPSPEWIPARELRIGDYVFFPRYRQVDRRTIIWQMGQRFKLNDLLAYALGWYVAEGSGGDSAGRVVSFALHREQRSQVMRLSAALRQAFGAQISVYTERNMNLVKITSSRTREITRLLKAWCGDNSSSKQIPNFILNSEARTLRVFLGALIDGDGHCPWRMDSTRSPASRENFLDITTLSTKLAHQLILAFSKLAVAAELVNHPGSVQSAYSVRVRGFDQIRRILPREKLPRGERIDRRHFWPTSDGFYYPIRSIESLPYTGPVYDFTADKFTMLSPFATLDCVTSWSIKDVVWEGVAFRELAKMTVVKPEARWVMFHCADGYTAPVPLEDAMVEDSLIAFKMNGRQIPEQQGFPARPFIPHLYGWKSAKWLTEIEFLPDYKDGYWEKFGYHERGDIWSEERFKGQGGKHMRRRGLGTLPI